tara:strand:- start:1400 stop:2188 length:789 start_codon:yes stop_codon:yes gene_type:complete
MSLSLQNVENYKNEYNCGISEIFTRYVGVIREYLTQATESISINNPEYYKYIICKGISTITHVFLNIFLYTRNLNLTYHYCQKSFYYYVEFIGRIEDDSHSFLQLNSKDAALFVYKKTLFEINNDYRKNFTVDTDIIMDTLNRTVRVYKHLIEDIITNCVIENKTILFIKIDHKLNKLSQNMINLFINSNEESNKYIRIIEFIEKKLEHKEVDRILILEILTKKMRKKDIEFKQIFNKINNKNNNCNLEDMSPQRYVNWLLI